MKENNVPGIYPLPQQKYNRSGAGSLTKTSVVTEPGNREFDRLISKSWMHVISKQQPYSISEAIGDDLIEFYWIYEGLCCTKYTFFNS